MISTQASRDCFANRGDLPALCSSDEGREFFARLHGFASFVMWGTRETLQTQRRFARIVEQCRESFVRPSPRLLRNAEYSRILRETFAIEAISPYRIAMAKFTKPLRYCFAMWGTRKTSQDLRKVFFAPYRIRIGYSM